METLNARRAIVLASICSLLACRTTPTSSTRPSESQLEDERARVAHGEDVGAKLRAPAIAVGAANLTVNDESVATGPITLARLDMLRAHLDALREHWTKIHPGRAFTGAPALALEPKLPADLALASLRVLAEAGFLHAKLDGGPELDLAPSSAGPVDVIEVTAPEDGGHEVSEWVAGNGCHVIMATARVASFANLSPEMRLTSLADSTHDLIVILRPGAAETAADLAESLRRLMTSPLVATRHGKLSFDWHAVSCATDGIFGHAR